MSSLLSAELAATCNALGSLDKRTGKYFVDGFTLDTVKDLIRYLRRDDEDHEIRRHLGQTKVLETDLLPILMNHSDNKELFDVTLRLAVNLTNPPLLLYREEIPTEKSGRRIYLQLLSHLHSYKANSFKNSDIWSVLAKRLSQILEINSGERDEDSGLVVERILILVRNILHVPADDLDAKRPDNDASVHDQVLWALNQSGLLDIILYMSSENEKPYFMHILEIISLALREQNPSSLADAALQRSVEEKLKDEQELLTIRSEEVKKRNEKIKNFSANRHSRFGGTFVVQNVKSISDNSMICHKPLNNVTGLNFDIHKSRFKMQKNLRHAVDVNSGERRSAFAIRLFLKEFCIEFLNASYNTMMYYVKDVLVRSKAQKNDETYYLWAMKFFMEFNRNYKFQVKLVSETMSVSIFHYVQQQMEKYGEMMIVDKKKTPEWTRRLHLALKAYHELLLTMMAMDKSNDKSVQDSSKVIKSNIFYVLEYREFILHMLMCYDEAKMPRAYLKDLIETVHIFLKMLEHFCKSHGLVVQKKTRSKAKKKSKSKPASKPVKTSKKQISEEMKEEMWEAIDTPLFELLQEGAEISTDIVPFDAALEKDIDEQKGDCTKKIQKLLSANKLMDAVGLLRAAREVWPENDIFGSTSIAVDEETSILKMIFMANIGAEEIDVPSEIIEEPPEESDNEEDEDEEDEDERSSSNIVETDFKFCDFAQRFCNPKVAKACGILLQNYEKNSVETNHCISKMLHRIAWDCKLPGMLFQASLFRTFQTILANNQDKFKELQKFAIFIVRKFTEVALKNPKVFAELLFWKNSREAYELEQGYEEDGWRKKTKVTWSEEQEEELRNLYNENQKNPSNDNDVIDWILENLIEKERSRQGVIKKLKEMGLIFRAPTRKNSAAIRTKVNVPFTDEEDEKLRELWETYSATSDPMALVLTRMPINRPRHRFVERLLTLGIIQDKKECRKKTQRKSGKENEGHESESDISNTESEDSDTSNSRAKQPKKKTSTSSKKAAPEISHATVVRTLLSCVDQGFSDSLKWIIESMEEVALDQEAEGYDPDGEGVPIVPILQDCVEAMENAVFQETLKCLGINPPSDEQESYWRIPATIHHETLRKICETITKAIDKTLVIPEQNTSVTEDLIEEENPANDDFDKSRNQSSSEEDDDLFTKLRNIGQNVNHSGNDIMPSTSKNKTNKKGKRKRERSNSDNEENSNNQSKFVSLLKAKSKQKQVNESDSEDETAVTSANNDITILSQNSNKSDEGSIKTSSTKRKHLESDVDSHSGSELNTTVSSRRSLNSTLRRSSLTSNDSNTSPLKTPEAKRKRHMESDSDSRSNFNNHSVSNDTTLLSKISQNNTLRHSDDDAQISKNNSIIEDSSDSDSNNVTVVSKKRTIKVLSSDSDDEDSTKNYTKTLKSKNPKNKIKKKQTILESVEDSTKNNIKTPKSKSSKSKIKKRQTLLESDSESELISKETVTDDSYRKNVSAVEKSSAAMKKKSKKIDLDSSDEENVKENVLNKSNSRTRDETNDGEVINKNSFLSSDESNDSFGTMAEKKKKRKTAILSDDSDDEVPSGTKQPDTNELFDSLL